MYNYGVPRGRVAQFGTDTESMKGVSIMNINVVIFRVTLKAFDWTTEKTISRTFEDARDFEQFEQSIEEQANFLLNWVEKHEPFWYPILDDILVDDYKHYEMILE